MIARFMKSCRERGNMYNSIKNIAKSIIPKKLLFENELFLRSFYAIFFKGKNHECNICNHKISRFINLKGYDLLCPYCGSLSRTRRLYQIINNEGIKGNILHFSPSRCLYRTLKKDGQITYFSTDFENEFLADYKFDITNINQEDDKFDYIICYHILEHITADQKAMKELYRVLKPGGKVFIQTPFKEGDIYEDDTIIKPEAREKHFGQNDHVRIYSIEGLKNRLTQNLFKVEIKNFKENKDDFYHGFISPETVLIASK